MATYKDKPRTLFNHLQPPHAQSPVSQGSPGAGTPRVKMRGTEAPSHEANPTPSLTPSSFFQAPAKESEEEDGLRLLWALFL